MQKAQKLLQGADAELRKLIVDAAGAGAYDELARLTDMARQLDALVASGDEAGSTAEPGVPTMAASSPRKPIRKYPAFFRREDELIRVGWSKKTRREYRQAMPHRAAEAVVAALVKSGSEKKAITVESLQPVKDVDGSDVPIYEIYNTVAWLRSEGLVRKRGRKGYSLQAPAKFREHASKAWSILKEYT